MALRRGLWRRIDRRYIDPACLPELNAARAAAGLAPVAHFMPHLNAVADQSITLFPAWYAGTPPDWPKPLLRGGFPLFDPAPDTALAGEVRAFLAAGEAPVVITLGTFQRHGAPVLAQVVAAVRALGRRALVLAADQASLTVPLADDLLWRPYVPLRLLLPHAAALVHHGGIGTTAEALRAAVPQLVLPWAFDQFDNAQRVVALGTGQTLATRRLRPERLQSTLRAFAGLASHLGGLPKRRRHAGGRSGPGCALPAAVVGAGRCDLADRWSRQPRSAAPLQCVAAPVSEGLALIGTAAMPLSCAASPCSRLCHITRGSAMFQGIARCSRQRLSHTTTSPAVQRCSKVRGGWQAQSTRSSRKRSEASGVMPGMLCACRPISKDGRPVSGWTLTSGRSGTSATSMP